MSRSRFLLALVGARGVGTLLTLAIVSCGGSDPGGTSRPEGLLAAYRAFAARVPDRADEIRPLTASEFTGMEAPGLTSSGLQIRGPIGRSLTDRPLLSWLAAPGADRYRVRLTALDGASSSRPIVDETTPATSIAFPMRAEALAVGMSYVLEVATEGGKSASGRSRFDVLPVPHRSRWKTLVGELESNEKDAVRDLLLAHAALRRGLIDEAERRLALFDAARPRDADAAALHTRLDVLLGR